MAIQLNQKSFQSSNCTSVDAVAEALESLLRALGDPGDDGKRGADGVSPVFFDRNKGELVVPTDGVDGVGGGNTGIEITNVIELEEGCAIRIVDHEINVDAAVLAGLGLRVSDGGFCPSLEANIACGFYYNTAANPDNPPFAVDVEALAGLYILPDGRQIYERARPSGLRVNDDPDGFCPSFEVNTGCGLYLDFREEANPDNPPIAVDVVGLAGIGLTVGEGSEDCPAFDVDLIGGCGINVLGSEISVNPADLAGTGLDYRAGDCALHFALTLQDCLVDVEILAGDGLRPGTEDCSIEVGEGNGITVNEDTIEVKQSCGITVDEDGVSVNTDDLTEGSVYLKPVGDACMLDVKTVIASVVEDVRDLKLEIDGVDLKIELSVDHVNLVVLKAFPFSSSKTLKKTVTGDVC